MRACVCVRVFLLPPAVVLPQRLRRLPGISDGNRRNTTTSGEK